MNKFKLFSLIIGMLGVFAGKAAALTELTASVDKNPVMVNESFVLKVVANDSLNANKLDLAPIIRSGLTVGRTSTSSQTQIINGKVSKTTTWSTVLLARQEGNYLIPSIVIDGVKTLPISVEATEVDDQTGQSAKPIFLKNTIESSEIYLQQNVKFISRLYFDSNINLQSGTLTDPVLGSGLIKQQGKDKESNEIVMGKRYRVIERIYRITPQASGKYTITSPTFNGEVGPDRRQSLFSSFGSTMPVSTIGDNLTINVLPIPTDYQGSWLPSDLVQLNDELQPQQVSYQVGEPITRTFTLTALNVNEEQLPDLKGQYPASFNVYPDQSESHSVLRQNAIVSQRVSSEAIVATQAGVYTLPAVSINWFNTKTRQVELATIPERRIEIVAADNAAENSLVTNVPLQQQDIVAQSCPQQEVTTRACPSLSELADSAEKQNLLLTLSGWIVWLLTLIVWFFSRKSKSSETTTKGSDKLEKSTFNDAKLKQACSNNDHRAARIELLAWAQARFGEHITNLSQLSALVSTELQQEIAKLNQSQYSQTRSDWSGTALWQLLKAETKHSPSKNKKGLPPLN